VTSRPGTQDMYDLTVDTTHTYFVSLPGTRARPRSTTADTSSQARRGLHLLADQ
jgi:hypothetical protein